MGGPHFRDSMYPFWLCGLMAKRDAPKSWPEEWRYFFNQGRNRGDDKRYAQGHVDGWLRYYSHYRKNPKHPYRRCFCVFIGDRCRGGKLGRSSPSAFFVPT